MPFPNLIIAGPPKTGSTSLFTWLSRHPDCFPSKEKETHFFADHVNAYNQKCNYIDCGIEAYSQLFEGADNHKIIFEATPSYIDSKNAFRNIPKLKPIPRMLFLYREPTERMWSEYSFFRYTLGTYQKSFAEYVGYDSTSFHGKNYERGRIVKNINRWTEAIGSQNTIVLKFADLKTNPAGLMKHLCDLLNIPSEPFDHMEFEVKNQTRALRNGMLHSLARKVRSYMPEKGISALTKIYAAINHTKTPGPTDEDQSIMHHLRKAYRDETVQNLIKPIENIPSNK